MNLSVKEKLRGILIGNRCTAIKVLTAVSLESEHPKICYIQNGIPPPNTVIQRKFKRQIRSALNNALKTPKPSQTDHLFE